jgi:hypothetical protein
VFDSARPGMKEVFESIKEKVMRTKDYSDEAVVKVPNTCKVPKNVWDSISTDLESILVEKTEGKSLARISAVETKNNKGGKKMAEVALLAFRTSGLAIAERMKNAMTPNEPKKEEDLPATVENW